MRLGHGCRARTPVGIWLFFFGSMAVCFPGGVWLKAQEGKESQEELNATVEKAEQMQSVIPLAPAAKGAWAESWQNERINVSDLLDKLEGQHGDREAARRALLRHIPQRSIQAVNAEGKVTISQLPAFSIDGDELHLFETRDQIAVVKRTIEELRRSGLDNVRLRFKLMAISADQLDKLGLPWEAAFEPASDILSKLGQIPTVEEIQAGGGLPAAPVAPNPVQYASATSGIAQPAPAVANERSPKESVQNSLKEFEQARADSFEFRRKTEKQIDQSQSSIKPSTEKQGAIQGLLEIDNSKVKKEYSIAAKSIATYCAVIDAKQADEISSLGVRGRSTLMSPAITCRSGSYAQMMSHAPWSTTPKLASFDRPAPIDSKPQLGFSGFSLAALPVIGSDTDVDAQPSVDLSLAVDVREVTRLDTFTFAGAKANEVDSETAAMTVEQPAIELKRLAVRCKLQPGESLLVSSRQPLAPESDGKVLVILVTCDV